MEQALGSLGKLPKELRLEIYNYLVPADFQQQYHVDPDYDMLTKSRKSSALPPFLATSKAIRTEALQSALFGMTCKININRKVVCTSFPLENLMHVDISSYDLLGGDDIALPICRNLAISVQPPSPRMPADFLQTRRNVSRVVGWLNRCNVEKLPKLSVKRMPRGTEGFMCGYNDFATLMGPLIKLQTATAGVMISRKTGFMEFDPKIERQCQFFESFLNGGKEGAKELVYQQAMIDIKLPLCIFKSNLAETRIWTPAFGLTPMEPLDRSSKIEILSGIKMLRGWCKEHGEKLPTWCNQLDAAVRHNSRMKPIAKELLDEIVEGRLTQSLGLWAAGLLTSFNPYYDQGEGYSIW